MSSPVLARALLTAAAGKEGRTSSLAIWMRNSGAVD